MAEAAVRQRFEDSIDFVNVQDWEKLAALYAPDGSNASPFGEPRHGREAIIGSIKKLMNHPNMRMKTVKLDVKAMTDEWVYSNAYFDIFDKDGALLMEFKDNVIWHKVDGQWYAVRDYMSFRSEPPTQ